MEFSIRESLAFGWEKTREHSGLLFGVLLTGFALQVLSSIVEKGTEENMVLSFMFSVLFAIAGAIVGAGFSWIALKLARNEHARYQDIVPPLPIVWRSFVTSLLVGIMVFVGLILFIAPGLYLAARFCMVRFTALESSGIVESLRKSTEMTEGIRWHMLRFLGALLGINILGLLCLVVGLIITIPVTLLAYAHVYDKLLKHRTA